MTKKRIAAVAASVLLVAAIGVVFANREKTRLRLSYMPGEVTVTRDIVYVEGSKNPKHRLDVYAPKGASRAPVVHFVHGGYWVEGDKDFYAFVSGLYGSIGTTLAKKGVVTVVQSYRLSPEVGIDAIVDDVMAALRWTEQHAADHGGDPKRVFMMGHSAGGHLVALAGSDPSLHTKRGMDPTAVRGYIPISAVWDIAGMSDDHGAEFNEKVTYSVFGRDRARWTEHAPLSKLHAGMQPFFVIIGERDFPYMIPQAEKARARLAEVGAPVRYLLVPGNDHSAMVLAFGSSKDNVSGPVVEFVTGAPAPVAPAKDAGAQLDALEGPWIRELPLEGGRKTWVAVPVGAREPLPVLVAVHGAGDRADWACSEWTAILAGTAIVVCPEGRPAQWKGTFSWGSAQHIAENADAALEAVRAKFGAHVGPWPPIYAAWSQGGTLAGQVMALRPKMYRRVVISEVGHTPLDPKATAVAMAGAGVERVIVSCSSAPCRNWARAFEREAGAQNVALKINDVGDRGHWFDEPVFKVLAPKVLWLIDKDEGWAGVSAGIEGKWGKP